MIMPLVLALVGLGGLLYFLSHKGGPGGISHDAAHQSIPVMAGDDKTIMPGWSADWHATDEQNALFGPRRPSFWNLNGYFMFGNTTGGYDHYKPDWQVPTSFDKQVVRNP